MNSRKITILAAGLILWICPNPVPAADLADRLPASTTVYASLNVGRLLKEGERLLTLTDEEHGENIVYQVRELHKILKELAAQHDFRPRLLDEIEACKLYFLLMLKDEPEKQSRTWKSPKRDNTGKVIPGEFNRHTYTINKEFTLILAIETAEDTAADFLEQYKKLQEHELEKQGKDGPAWKEVEVEQGSMVESTEEGEHDYVGVMGNLVVIADSNPRELWAALMARPEKTLAQTQLFQRYTQGPTPPLGIALVDLQGFVRKAEDEIRESVKNAREKASRAVGTDREQMTQRMAMMQDASLSRFLLFKQLFSLDKIQAIGARVNIEVNDNSIRSGSRIALHFTEPVSRVAKLILNGGKALQSPGIGARNAMAFMGRFGARQVFDHVMTTLPPQYTGVIDSTLEQFKQAYGLDTRALISLLAGDMYMYMDMVKREYETYEWDPATNQMNKMKKVGPLPQFLFLLGLDDPEAATQMLSDIFTKISAIPGMAAFFGKRTYQETNIYVIGRNAADENMEPDGLYSYALVVLGRHLSFGSWKDMTGLVRRARTAQTDNNDPVAKAIGEHPQSNLLLVAPKSFNLKIQEMMKDSSGKDPMQALIEKIATQTIPLEDKELAERVRTAVTRLIENYVPLAKKLQTMGRPCAVVHGKRKGGFYEIEGEDEITR